jgi:predicted nucleic acid-binding protein
MLIAPASLPLVLDTNVVLDWLVFRDPSSRPVEASIRSGQRRWYVTAAMRLEAERVLTFKRFASHTVDFVTVFTAWDALAEAIDPAPPPLSLSLRCTDPDDQKFIDLAVQLGRGVLLSRDRAVLKLARRARPLGLTIATPEMWADASARERREQVAGG